MLNFLILLLVALNAGLFAYQQGALSSLFSEEHEPTRLSQQLNPEKIQILRLPASNEEGEKYEVEAGQAEGQAVLPPIDSASDKVSVEANKPADDAPAAPAVTVASALAPTSAARTACYAVSNLNPTTAKRFETQLARLKLGVQPSRQETNEAGSYMVLYPPQENRAAAEVKAAELRQAGVTELYVMAEQSAHPWGISLGVFRAEEAARVQLANLALKGVQGAKLVPHSMTLKAVSYQFRNIDDDTRAKIAQLAGRFDQARSAACS